ncbi:MAG: hypothetical protein UY26_C0003G0105 [Candidatus Jorgensenbacteria bacterium GW2011_GWA1_48_13]|uniref:Uncharacterized protein n=1 Tax=Candidatus Jorgensenbacteria bacterium GW2011_GWB1_50_10 TaxID=1618665 RepID=A0A0G1Z7V7_9BACT|nr:MAG: hypothetical protein UY26_C0003G0105 [Candidatus Jorgensenbacteria bacterium GW2011_GWA1_48_13]KKW15064.1 MAG: hypothetical protein UY55_C0002G0122 [Candidatus Jorgensenbacteria bacterium GW2011_GWB1_50_10]
MIKIITITLIIFSLPILAYGQGIDVSTILNFLFPSNVLTGLTEAWNTANNWLQDRFGLDLRRIVSWLGGLLVALFEFFIGIIKWIIELVKK